MESIIRNESELREKAKHITNLALRHSSPRSSQFHLLSGGQGEILFTPNASRLTKIKLATSLHLEHLAEFGDESFIRSQLVALGLDNDIQIDNTPLENPDTYALSLAIAQKCNMGCAYCYADQGNFGEKSKVMPLDTALQAVDFLFTNKFKGDRVNIAFMGGEPLLSRTNLRTITSYAKDKGDKSGVTINFSITTNGTLLQEDDGAFFEAFGFAVTISLDGKQKEHDALSAFN